LKVNRAHMESSLGRVIEEVSQFAVAIGHLCPFTGGCIREALAADNFDSGSEIQQKGCFGIPFVVFSV
jgi:hypothetical protein